MNDRLDWANKDIGRIERDILAANDKENSLESN